MNVDRISRMFEDRVYTQEIPGGPFYQPEEPCLVGGGTGLERPLLGVGGHGQWVCGKTPALYLQVEEGEEGFMVAC